MKIPTRIGIEFKAAYRHTSGLFLNPEEKLPKNGQAVIGVNIPVLQGLLFDEPRAQILKSQTLINAGKLERTLALNDFLLEALAVYWKWYFANRQIDILRKALQTSEARFVGIKKLYALGDRMALDTLESFIQVQDRSLQFRDAQQELFENAYKLNNFLFDSLSALVAPSNNINFSIPEKAEVLFKKMNHPSDFFSKTHPLTAQYDLKLQQFEIDIRLKKEKLKPKLNLNYNFLGDGISYPSILTDNYKYGINFSSSLLLRSERANLQLSRLKVENTLLQKDQKMLELNNKFKMALSQWQTTEQLLKTTEAATENYRKLLELETKRFNLGESTFFLINARETKFLESQIKVAKLFSEIQISFLRLLHARAELPEFFGL